MILARSRIAEESEAGNITIRPFDPRNTGPNSHDVTLGPELRVYVPAPATTNAERVLRVLKRVVNFVFGYERFPILVLDARKENMTKAIVIPKEGIMLMPRTVYLGNTNETATSHVYTPMYDGRSSIGRLGIKSHLTAGFGDLAFGSSYDAATDTIIQHYPTWTLEIEVTHPVRVYAGMRIGQVSFHEVRHAANADLRDDWYTGKYGKQKDAQASLAHLDVEVTGHTSTQSNHQTITE